MRHIFVMNSYAGKGKLAESLETELKAYADTIAYEVYHTTAPGDATRFVRAYCAEHAEEPVRFYACGGDGTLQEVANGIVEFPHASMSAYPCGSGDDFVKYYGGRDRFLDLPSLLEAEEKQIDLIHIDDTHHAINACHFGFDSAVAVNMNKIRHKKIIGGKRAYPVSVAKALLSGMVTRCTVTVDGEMLNPSGELLLCTVANGQYVGGSYRCAPLSENDDGWLEVCLVRPLSRLTFVSLMSAYKEGRHLTDPRFEKYITYRRGKCVEISSPEPDFACSLDGEIIYGQQICATVMEKAIRFAVPIEATKEEVVLK